MMCSVQRYLSVCVAAGIALAGLAGQAQTAAPPTRNAEASRAELESMLSAAMHDTASGSEEDRDRARRTVNNLRDRLTNGDFQVGDRVLIYVQGQATLSDTFTVREGQMIHLPNLTDVDLHGVLRSELQGHVYSAVSKYLRDPVVRTGSLVRIAVLGDVQHAGFYALPADLLVSDAIMHAGGLAGSADVGRTTIRRGADVIWQPKDVTVAIRDGETIDQMSLRAGDQIDVGTKKPNTLLFLLPIVGGVVGITTGIVLITRH
jgi:protein involved in polysaccharide export with SLBB domain